MIEQGNTIPVLGDCRTPLHSVNGGGWSGPALGRMSISDLIRQGVRNGSKNYSQRWLEFSLASAGSSRRALGSLALDAASSICSATVDVKQGAQKNSMREMRALSGSDHRPRSTERRTLYVALQSPRKEGDATVLVLTAKPAIVYSRAEVGVLWRRLGGRMTGPQRDSVHGEQQENGSGRTWVCAGGREKHAFLLELGAPCTSLAAFCCCCARSSLPSHSSPSSPRAPRHCWSPSLHFLCLSPSLPAFSTVSNC